MQCFNPRTRTGCDTAAVCGFSRPYSPYARAPGGILVYGNFCCSPGRTRTATLRLRGVLPLNYGAAVMLLLRAMPSLAPHLPSAFNLFVTVF